jgi:hypothetical protein
MGHYDLSRVFQQRVLDRVSSWDEKRREIKALRRTTTPLTEAVVAEVARAYNLTQREVREQRGRNQEAKGVAMTLIRDLCGVSLREIEAMFGGKGGIMQRWRSRYAECRIGRRRNVWPYH